MWSGPSEQAACQLLSRWTGAFQELAASEAQQQPPPISALAGHGGERRSVARDDPRAATCASAHPRALVPLWAAGDEAAPALPRAGKSVRSSADAASLEEDRAGSKAACADLGSAKRTAALPEPADEISTRTGGAPTPAQPRADAERPDEFRLYDALRYADVHGTDEQPDARAEATRALAAAAATELRSRADDFDEFRQQEAWVHDAPAQGTSPSSDGEPQPSEPR